VSTLNAVRLVAGREAREALRRRSMWVTIGVLFLGSSAAMIVPEVIDSGPTTYDVAIVGEAPGLAASLAALEPALGAEIRVERVATTSAAERQVEADDADVGIVPGLEARILVKSGKHDRLVGAVRQALAGDATRARLKDAGLTDAQIEDVFTLPAPKVEEIDAESGGRRAAAFAVTIVLYLLLLNLMMQVANGTALEKANRISEVLLPIVRPGALLFGKVVGVSATGIVLLVSGLLPVIAKLVAGGDLPDGIGGTLAGSSVWFVLGLALYLTLAGSLGALVERQEEAGSAMAPLVAVLIGTFIVSQGGSDTPLGSVLAYIPLTSPLVVPSRLALGVSSPIEMAGSVTLLLLAIVLAGRLGSALYGRAIVRTGRRLKLREVVRPS
jgi:ABC-2 type transport system permease protein